MRRSATSRSRNTCRPCWPRAPAPPPRWSSSRRATRTASASGCAPSSTKRASWLASTTPRWCGCCSTGRTTARPTWRCPTTRARRWRTRWPSWAAPPTRPSCARWLRPLLDALGTMHALSCFHRDIAPDNILLTDTGPVLLDFGAARRVIDSAGQSPTVVFKPGFTPIEQYGELASMRQGPWTDLYALAAWCMPRSPGSRRSHRSNACRTTPCSRCANSRTAAMASASWPSSTRRCRCFRRTARRARPSSRPGWAPMPRRARQAAMPRPARPAEPPAVEAAKAPALHAAARSFVPAIARPAVRRVRSSLRRCRRARARRRRRCAATASSSRRWRRRRPCWSAW